MRLNKQMMGLVLIMITLGSGCTSPMRSRQRIKTTIPDPIGHSIPENSVEEIRAATFDIKSDGIKVSEAVSSKVENKVKGKYQMLVDGKFMDGFISADGDYYAALKNGVNETHKHKPDRKKLGHLKIFKDANHLEFYEWYHAYQAGQVVGKTISLLYVSEIGDESRIDFFGCFPAVWKGETEETESIEIVFERYKSE
ncbi:MAG TPA: hypothetical protein VNJ08_07090 [Bacteriovoracaceae bacterium]|nr:hypothetical protein [Bacteriovoracaceae bacterium]